MPDPTGGTAAQDEQDWLYANGVDAKTGEPLLPAIPIAELAERIKSEPLDEEMFRTTSALAASALAGPMLGLPDDILPWDVTKAGWAVVFHKEEDAAVKQAVLRLYDHRRQQIGDDTRVKVLEYAGESNWIDWLAKYEADADSPKPWRVPYYLLLVGGPERIPFGFCQGLCMGYVVGLLHFADAAGYARYVDSVIAYETGSAPPRSKEAVFFRTNHDRATQLSAEHLVAPLADGVPAANGEPYQPAVAENKGFVTRRIWDDAATAAALAEVLAPPSGAARPAFLFTASHGVGFVNPDPVEQPALQGAIRCQDKTNFGAEQLAGTAGVSVHGLIAFFFACYSAGTPLLDQYVNRPDRPPLQIAEKPFLAALPTALLCHPQGGALACIGHVERAWNYSFSTPKLGDQLVRYQNAVGRILAGKPVGYSLQDMHQRYMLLSHSVAEKVKNSRRFSLPLDARQLVADWAARNDAGGYIVIGDPAVCLRTE